MKPHELGETLRADRERKGYSLRQLESLSGVAHSTIGRIESGSIASPKPEHLQRLSLALETDVEDYYALAGFIMPEKLPELRPYLRLKYNLPEGAANQLDEYFQALRDRWTTPTNQEKNSGGDKAS
jgi:transcriptional regulator with XRE-family HTH domain